MATKRSETPRQEYPWPNPKAMLAEKTWIGFDLDDTLHEFRHASGRATDEVLETISCRYGIPKQGLKDSYSAILKDATMNAFSDGKTSFEYRRQRFTALLTQNSVPMEEQFMTELLEIYESTLTASLRLKSGATELLSTLKANGKKIVIITEGPQDAQERTIQGLGIGGYVEFLATTNRFGVSKTNGLFPKVLKYLGIEAGEMLYIGDSEERDMKPAMAAGILSVHLDEARDACWESVPMRISCLKDLQLLVAHE